MPRFLVVDDSAAMRTFVRSVLVYFEADVEVVEAASGFDALRLLPRSRYDLVITDINMPDINGLELIRFVRQSEHHKNTALVIISTQSSDRDRERGMKLGANTFLSKPFTPEALREAVAQSLAASRR
jgi:two-component system chemotaxis response regulator CheY